MKIIIILPNGKTVSFDGLTKEQCEKISEEVVCGMSIDIRSNNDYIFSMNSNLVQNSFFSFVPE